MYDKIHRILPCCLTMLPPPLFVPIEIVRFTGRSFLANYVSRFASATESGAGRILESKPNLRRNHFSSNLISRSASLMPSPTYISLWYFNRSFPQVLKRQSVDRVPCPLSFDTSFLSSWLEAKLSPGRQQMDPNTRMDTTVQMEITSLARAKKTRLKHSRPDGSKSSLQIRIPALVRPSPGAGRAPLQQRRIYRHIFKHST